MSLRLKNYLRNPKTVCFQKTYRSSCGCNIERELFLTADEFSNEDLHHPGIPHRGQAIVLEWSDDEKIYFIFYANGAEYEYKGYVSVVITCFSNLSFPFPFDFSCVISVVDVRGNRRYSQSLAISRDRLLEKGTFQETIGRFVSRKSLLSEQSDLLPEDILTFSVDFYYADYMLEAHCNNVLKGSNILEYVPKIITEKVQPSEELHSFQSLTRNEKRFAEMDLDSCLVQKLAEHSECFQALLRTEMREKETRTIKLDLIEAIYLKDISLVMNGEFYEIVRPSILFHWYKTAHKYLIQTALDMVREGMIHILCADTIDMISEVAQEYNDHYLKKIIKEFDGKAFYRKEVYVEYPYYSLRRSTLDVDIFIYFQGIKQETQRDVCPDFDFYK